MAKKSGTKHMKRIAMPKSFGMPRKELTWVINPLPGRHSKFKSISLVHAIISLGFAKTAKEAKHILNTRKVLIDGVPKTEEKDPVGFMDVITVDKESWRAVFDQKGRIVFKSTSKPSVKLCKVVNKMKIKGGKMQLTLHDGKNIIGFDAKPGDTVEVSIPEGKAIGKIALQKNALCFLIGGKKVGSLIKVSEIIDGSATRKSEIHGELEDGKPAITLKEYLFPVKEGFI